MICGVDSNLVKANLLRMSLICLVDLEFIANLMFQFIKANSDKNELITKINKGPPFMPLVYAICEVSSEQHMPCSQQLSLLLIFNYLYGLITFKYQSYNWLTAARLKLNGVIFDVEAKIQWHMPLWLVEYSREIINCWLKS